MSTDTRVDELVAARKQAEKVVEGMPEGPLKLEAFKAAFQDLMDHGSRAPTAARAQPRHRAKGAQPKAAPKKRQGSKAHVSELLEAGFFKAARDVQDVAKELLRRTHKYPPHEVSTALIRLTEDGKLQRRKEKPQQGRTRWVYLA